MRRLLFVLMSFFLCCVLPAFSSPKVLLGVDRVTEPKYLKLLAGKRVGLLTNLLAVNSHGERTVDVFLHLKNIKLTVLFGPEGGLISGQPMNNARLGVIPIYSVYKPGDSQLDTLRSGIDKAMNRVDVIVYDLQSVGVRYYTFITSLALIMQEAKKLHKKVIVLDRPNPLNGLAIVGAITAEKNMGKGICYYPIPMQYGLTIGELGQYFNRYYIHGVDYTVIPMAHWTRDMLFFQTGLKWAPPTSALMSFQQTFIYGILGPLEGANIAVGRGMSKFDQFVNYGAPYITKQTARKIVHDLQAAKLPGLTFKLSSWVPTRDVFKGVRCHGFHIGVTAYSRVRRFYSTVKVLKILYHYAGDRLKIQNTENWIGAPWVINDILKGVSANAIIKTSRQDSERYRKNSKSVWIYPSH